MVLCRPCSKGTVAIQIRYWRVLTSHKTERINARMLGFSSLFRTDKTGGHVGMWRSAYLGGL